MTVQIVLASLVLIVGIAAIAQELDAARRRRLAARRLQNFRRDHANRVQTLAAPRAPLPPVKRGAASPYTTTPTKRSRRR